MPFDTEEMIESKIRALDTIRTSLREEHTAEADGRVRGGRRADQTRGKDARVHAVAPETTAINRAGTVIKKSVAHSTIR